ncbi:hypothetical protein F4779DRAFT_635047 [Xylariaceae sp. FL0662B]|nr:hypothetical protein F4779DRAFT_635047 [Xylariaceae sp. FL0662B]
MYRVARHAFMNYHMHSSAWKRDSVPNFSGYLRHGSRSITTESSKAIPHLEASDYSSANELSHLGDVVRCLRQSGILKISLGFLDNNSQYLEQLLLSLHRHHGHQLPITHSATRGWFWDIRPSTINFQTENIQARSETMKEFPWHTDCSYEDPPPRYFALQVLQPDRCGGGTLSLMNVARLSELLSPAAQDALMCPEYQITTPPEFIKDHSQQQIIRSLLTADEEGRPSMMRLREDIVKPLSQRASQALEELKQALRNIDGQPRTIIRLTSADLPERTIIIVDNRRFLHARTDVKDPERHLRRVRWDAVPFCGVSN